LFGPLNLQLQSFFNIGRYLGQRQRQWSVMGRHGGRELGTKAHGVILLIRRLILKQRKTILRISATQE
jgi:hypothetical protein